jgi:hypothetical protein
MARMIPSVWEDRNGSRAEGLIYRKLRDETPEDWFAIHSVGLIGHEFKSWAEIDFVLVGPFGVICLEVKGGRIALRDGIWFSNENRLSESPFQQAGGGAAALRARLREVFPRVKRALVEYAVAFPDVRFDARGPSIEPALVYDERDLRASIAKFVDRVERHWRSYRGLESNRFRPLGKKDRSDIVEWIAPTFDLVPALRTSVELAEAELCVLTESQTRILRGMQESDRLLVRGGAGTGKTLLAVEEARRLDVAGLRVLFCCRSVPLATYLRELMAGTGVDVRALEPLMWDLVREAGREEHLPPASEEDLFAVFLPEQALEGAVELGLGQYDALVLDEAQDLLFEPALDLFDVLLKHGLETGIWRIFLDHRQRVFASVDSDQWDRLSELSESQYGLFENCRNTPQIATITALLSAQQLDRPLASDGPGVEVRFADDNREEVAQAALVVKEWVRSGLDPGSITILGCSEEPPPILTAEMGSLAPLKLTSAGTNGGRPTWSSISSFKGLEASAVVVVGIQNLRDPEMLRRVYVGCSRARSLLAVVLRETAREDFAVRTDEFERRGEEGKTQ